MDKKVVRPMTEHDVNVAEKIGSLSADMRTVKHDVANVQQSLGAIQNGMNAGFVAVTAQITAINMKREKSLGFIAGATAVITLFCTILAGAIKLIFGAHV